MLFHHRFACVSVVPLGRPVVPEVYMITAGSSGRMSVRCARGTDDAESRSTSSQPGGGSRLPPPRHEVPLYRYDAALSVDETCVVGVGDQGMDGGMVNCIGKFRTGEAEVQRN